MNHLHGCHKGLYSAFRAAKQMVGLLHQHGAQTLAACTHTVIHRLKNGFLMSFFFRKVAFYNRFYLTGPFLQFFTHLHLPLHLPAG